MTAAEPGGAAAPTPHVLVVTSAGAQAAVVVPVLAALEASGARVRALDVGAAGGGGASVGDRLRRALLGESAERRLRKELELNPPDVAVAFDPHATQALGVARDQVATPAPVVAIVGELDPSRAWAEAGADRYCACDPECAVALADLGVEGERVLVTGVFGPRAWADAARDDRAALRARFKLAGAVVLVEVAGLGAEKTAQLALQMSLSDAADGTTYLFDAGTDVDAAAVLRKQVPALGLRAKLFGATADAPLLWRAAEVAVAVPRADALAKAALVGARLVALVDDTVPGVVAASAAIEARRRGVAARSLLLVGSAIDAMARAPAVTPAPDGADRVADVCWVVAADKRAVVDERHAAARAETRERVRAATSAAQAQARVVAAPGELEDLGGGGGLGGAGAGADAVDDDGLGMDRDALARLHAETRARKADLERAMTQARASADGLSRLAESARGAGKLDEARQAERKADAERARMHGLLGELAQIETELIELGRAVEAAGSADARATAARAARSAAGASAATDDPFGGAGGGAPRRPAPGATSIEDQLAALKRQGGAAPGAPPRPSSSSSSGSSPGGRSSATPAGTVDDELAALKRKMAQTPRKK